MCVARKWQSVWVFVLIVHVIIMHTRNNFLILYNDCKVIIKIIPETFTELITVPWPLSGFLHTRWDLEVSCLRPCRSGQLEGT